jgi:hypothetical protein
MTHDTDLIRRIDAMQATQVGPSDEWANATKSGYNQAATDIAMNIMKIAAAPVTVRVKPLVWSLEADQDSDDYGAWVAHDVNVRVRYATRHTFAGGWKLSGSVPFGQPLFPTIEAAKAAAQADYEARVLAALDVIAPDAMKGGDA